MTSIEWGWAAVAALALGTIRPAEAAGQFVPAVAVSGESACALTAVARRLATAHPLGGAAEDRPLGVDSRSSWVPTAPLNATRRRVWRRALRHLSEAGGACRIAAETLDRLEAAGRVSVWHAADTVGGLVFFGATYLASDATPISVQFWSRTFEQPLWSVTRAMAHEGFHVLEPAGAEEEAGRFGDRCAQKTTPVRHRSVATVSLAGDTRGWR